MKIQLHRSCLQRHKLLILTLISLTFTLNGFAQVFTKITDGPLVNEQANSYYSSWGDYDGDGDLDLFQSLWFASPEHPEGNSILYQNNCDGTFTRVKKIPDHVLENGLDGLYSNWIDYDNDGDLDLYVGNEHLYENQGNGSFIQVQKTITNLPNYTTATTGGIFNVGRGTLCWLDADNDGDLDVYNGRKEFYRNNGNKDFDIELVSPFKDLTEFIRGDGITAADFNNDGLMDIYICSPSSNSSVLVEGILYQNVGNGNFIINDNTPITNNQGFSYGCAWADIDNDLDLDLYVSMMNINGGYRDKLFQNNGDGTFTDLTTSEVAQNINSGQAGSAFADYDNDGDMDLLVCNFSTNYLYDNNGDGTFTRNTTEIMVNEDFVESFGACWADYDNDGDLDLFMPTAFGDPNDRFYQNNTTNRNWLKVHCTGITSNTDALGARVYVKATINGQSKWQMREISANTTRGGESGGVSGHVVHFGLGDATIIETLKIVWPASGITQEFQNVDPNQFLHIIEDQTTLAQMEICTPDLPLENPGIVSGKLYLDKNENCIYDAGIDVPIANKALVATPGNYYTYSNDNGDYTFELPDGTYNVSNFDDQTDFEVKACLSSGYDLQVSSSLPKQGKDFPYDKILIPCVGTIDLSINRISIDPDDCPSGQLNLNPCPDHDMRYCIQIANNSDNITPANSIVNIDFDQAFIDIIGISINGGSTIPGNGTSNQIVNIVDPIIVGGFINVCVDVHFDLTATGSFNLCADFNPPTNTGVNLVTDGSFEAMIPLNVLPTSTAYINDCTFGGLIHDEYCIISNANTQINLGHTGTAFAGTRYLYADGSTTGAPVWCQTISVIPNAFYDFSAMFCNTLRVGIADNLPNLEVTINGVVIGTSGPMDQTGWPNPNDWRLFAPLNPWCSGDNIEALICIRDLNLIASGNDFGIDDIRFTQRPNTGPGGICIQDLIGACSCDPNDKRVTPTGCGINGNVAKDQELTYHIRFENTGSGPATTVILNDQLDENLDFSTLQIVGASHPITWTGILPDNKLIIEFENINLASNLLDPVAAKGYVIFKIKPKTGLPDGTVINNQCGIYFDRNEAVLTEVTTNTLYEKPNPEAAFTYKHSCSSTGLVYDFTYTGGTADNATYFWEFEDGVVATSTAQNPTGIVFANANGYKLVTLTVTRNGCSETVFDTIQVASALSANGKKVTICHNGQTIQVDKNSLANHLAHGDCVGACAESFNNKSMESAVAVTESVFSVSLAPNPSNESCKISVRGLKEQGKMTVEVYNYTGQLQKTFTSDQSEVNLSTKEFTNGIYFIKVTSDENSQVGKLLIQH